MVHRSNFGVYRSSTMSSRFNNKDYRRMDEPRGGDRRGDRSATSSTSVRRRLFDDDRQSREKSREKSRGRDRSPSPLNRREDRERSPPRNVDVRRTQYRGPKQDSNPSWLVRRDLLNAYRAAHAMPWPTYTDDGKDSWLEFGGQPPYSFMNALYHAWQAGQDPIALPNTLAPAYASIVYPVQFKPPTNKAPIPASFPASSAQDLSTMVAAAVKNAITAMAPSTPLPLPLPSPAAFTIPASVPLPMPAAMPLSPAPPMRLVADAMVAQSSSSASAAAAPAATFNATPFMPTTPRVSAPIPHARVIPAPTSDEWKMKAAQIREALETLGKAKRIEACCANRVVYQATADVERCVQQLTKIYYTEGGLAQLVVT